jgi:anti-sigma factor (TIGR02949 family)
MTTPPDCLRALDALQDLLCHEADPATAASIEQHLAACAPCRRHAEFETKFLDVLKRAADEKCPGAVRARLLAALRKETGGGP